MVNEKHTSWFVVVVGGILMIAGVLARFYIIFHAGSWWFDESASYSFAKTPILQSWQYLKYENSPPLYYWLLRGWGLLSSFNEISLRMFSLITGFAAMVAIIFLVAQLFDRETGLWAGAIYAIASLSIFSDTEARMYSLLGLLIILSYFYFIKFLNGTFGWAEIFLYECITLVALYTSVTALWVPFTQIILLIFLKPKETKRLKISLLIIVPVLFFFPWLIAFALERLAFSSFIAPANWWYFRDAASHAGLLFEPTQFFDFWGLLTNWGTVAFLGSSILLGWFIVHCWKRRKGLDAALVIVSLGFLVPLIISFFTIDLGAPRYYYQSALFFWIILAFGIKKWSEYFHANVMRIVFLFALAIYAFSNIQPALQYSLHSNWNSAADWMIAHHPDLVLAMPKMWTAEVYAPSLPFYFLPPPVAALQTGLDSFQRVVRYNYNWGSLSDQLTANQEIFLSGEIDRATAHTSRIAFAYEGSDVEKDILVDLSDLGFQPMDEFAVEGYAPETVVIFERQPSLQKSGKR